MADFRPTTRRRVVGGSSLVQANPQTFSQASRAISRAGQQLAQTGQQIAAAVAQREQQRQAIDDFKAESDSRLTFNQSLDNLRMEIEQEPDRAKFESIWTDKVNTIDGALPKDNISPATRAKIQQDWEHTKARAQVLIKTEDARRAAEEARVSTQNEVQSHLENDNLLLAQETVRAATDARVYSAEQGQKILDNLDHQYDAIQASKAIRADPYTALEQLGDQTETGRYRNYKHLSESERRAMEQHARSEINRHETELYNSIILVSQSGELDNATARANVWQQAQSMNKQGRLSDARTTALRNVLFPKNNLPNWSLVSPLYEAVMNVDTSGGQYSKEVVKLRQRLATENIPTSERGKLLNTLEERFSSPDSVPNNLEYQAAISYINRQLKSGALGFEFGPDGFSRQPTEAAHVRAHELRREIGRLFRGDPKLTYEQAKERLSGLYSQQLSEGAADIFTPQAGRHSATSANPVTIDEIKAKLRELNP